ncbi:MAG: LiaI-LiaF-like domain-containing protein [Sphingobacteriaceae bacterium]
MRTEKIIWGLILVFIGGVLLLQNFGVINFHWQIVFRFWPMILILIGANLLFSKDGSAAGAVISVLITVLALGFITYKGITTKEDDEWAWYFKKDEEKTDSGGSVNVFSEEYDNSISKAVLNISGGATRYTLSDTTSKLFYADVKKHFGKYSLFRTFRDSTQVLTFKMNGKSGWDLNDDVSNKAEIKLNSNPVWDINMEMGAGAATLNLSSFKINHLSIKGGAASYEIKLGEPLRKTTVLVETGVSEIEIAVPKQAACKINIESGMSSNDFEGFIRQSDGSYISENFKNSSNIILLNLEGGLSKFKVVQY